MALAVAVAVVVLRTGLPPGPEERVDQLQVAARSAPGTGALRDAGCETALVFDGQEALEAFGPLLQGLGGFREDTTVVVCIGAPTQDCGELARLFGASLEAPPERFFLLASGSSREGGLSDASLCSGLYAPDGHELDPFDPDPQTP
ncbi:MAG: hypothetical protein ACQGVK_14440 [Myxococcota bacterium]